MAFIAFEARFNSRWAHNIRQVTFKIFTGGQNIRIEKIMFEFENMRSLRRIRNVAYTARFQPVFIQYTNRFHFGPGTLSWVSTAWLANHFDYGDLTLHSNTNYFDLRIEKYTKVDVTFWALALRQRET